jgi:TolB protein
VHTDADELPVDVALGKVDYLEIVAFSDHQVTASVWYRLLNLGFRLPAAGGTDAMADYATLRGPVGLNRVYASVPNGTLSSEAWLASLRAGRTFATNGPLLDFSLERSPPGAVIDLERPRAVSFSARMHAIVPVEHVQVVCNGQVARELRAQQPGDTLALQGSIPIRHSGWCLLRAFTAHAEYPVLDNFVYSTTSPVYVSVRGEPPRSPEDARFFLAWIEHLRQVTATYPDWNSDAEKAAVLRELDQAQAVYAGMR